jgi:iron complex outermembrane receptor protein
MRHRLQLLALSLLATSAAAQQADTTKLPTVSVTASRSGGSLFTVPLAVTRVTPSDWSGLSGYGLDAALTGIPGVLAQSRNGNSDIRLTIRGFGSRGAGDRSNSGTSRGVRVLTNGVPETEPDGRTSYDNIDLGMASSIEVVRSNASALWGNAAGGVVNISTIPSFSQARHDVSVTSGGYGLKRIAFSGSVPRGEGGSYFSAVNSSFEGYRKNSGSTRMAVDMGVVAPFGGNTVLRTMITGSINKFSVPGPLTQAQYDTDPTQANATYLSRRERRDNKLGRMAVAMEHNFDANSSLSTLAFAQTKYLQRSERGTYRDFNRYHLGGNGVYRLKHAAGDNKGTFSLGADLAYQDGSIQFYSLSATQERGTTLSDNKREGANNVGIFAGEDLEIGEKWLLSIGARYDAITYTYSSYITPSLNTTKSFTGVTPKLGLTYKMSPTHSWWASYGGGVEAPAGNETDPEAGTPNAVYAINPLLDPIHSSTLEVGTRRIWVAGADDFVQSISYDAAGFFTTVMNELVPYNGGRFYFTAGSAERKGVEFGATVGAKGGWSLKTGITMMSATYTDYVVDSVHYGKAGARADYSGKDIVGVPQSVISLNLGWAPEALNGLKLQWGMQNIGEYVVDDANAIQVPSSSVMSAGVTSTRAYTMGDHFSIRGSVMVTNLLDTKYAGSAYLNPDRITVGGTSVPAFLEPGLPRQVVLSLSVGHTP